MENYERHGILLSTQEEAFLSSNCRFHLLFRMRRSRVNSISGAKKRSATYLADNLTDILAKPIRLTADVKTENKQVKNRLANLLSEQRQAWLSRRNLLQQIADKGFSVSSYLREKQMSMLDAIDEKSLKSKRKRKK